MCALHVHVAKQTYKTDKQSSHIIYVIFQHGRDASAYVPFLERYRRNGGVKIELNKKINNSHIVCGAALGVCSELCL